MAAGRYGRFGLARDRLIAILAAAAGRREPCPSNRELCRRADISQPTKVTELLGVLRRHGRVAVQATAPGGPRRIAVIDPASGGARWTDWSRPMAGFTGDAMGEALGGRRFADATADERRRWARRTPQSAKLPRLEPEASPIGCALADLRGNPEFAPEVGP